MKTIQGIKAKDYGAFLAGAGIPYNVNGSFLVAGTPSFDGRWLICLSVCLRDTEQILANVLPVLIEYGVPFMLIKDQLQHNRINNHAFPPALFGKPLILFPEDAEQAIWLAEDLGKITDTFEGVFIPGCIRLSSIVYATYSTKNPDFDPEDPDSLPFRFSANEVPSPFPSASVWKEKPIKRFLKRRYLPISLIRSSHKGNILKGLDLRQLKWVFIKQANAWAAEDFHGRTMRDRLLWQMEVSAAVQSIVRMPKMLGFVEQDGYSYLISEYIDGKSLEQLIILNDAKDPEVFHQLLAYYFEALYLVSFFHDAGYIHRDLTAKNILIREGKVYLTDLELTYPIHEQAMPPYASGTFGYMSPQQRRNEQPTVAEDVYAMGAVLYYIASGEQPKAMSMLPEAEREDKLKQLAVPNKLKQLLVRSLKDDPAERTDLLDLLQSTEDYLTHYYIQQAPIWRKARKKKNVQKLIISAGLMILACITVTILWLLSDEPNSHPNGFTRNFLSEDLSPMTEITVPKDTRYIAGVVGDSLYFSTRTPGEVTILHIPSRKMSSRFIVNNPAILSQLNISNIVYADHYGLALFDGVGRLMVLNEPGSNQKILRLPESFSRAVRVSQNSIALRKFKHGEPDQYLYRYDIAKTAALDESRVTEPSRDGGLVTGGLLDFDPEEKVGAYVTRYANHVTLVDTNMRVLKIGHTLDTFSHYTLESRIVAGGRESKITNGGPAKFVNREINLHNRQLFVYSYVKADNETAEQFMDSNVIDRYRTTDLKYLGSYRLPTIDKQRIRNFKIQGSRLYVLYPGILKVYQLPKMQVSLKTAG